MTYKQRAKPFMLQRSRALILLAALAGSSCMTNWQKVDATWQPTGRQEKTVIDITNESQLSRSLSIDDLTAEHTIQIDELGEQHNFRVENYGTRAELAEIATEQRRLFSVFPAWTLVGATGGFLFSSGRENSNSLYILLGGTIAGAVFDFLGPAVGAKNEIRTNRTGIIKLGTDVAKDGSDRASLGSVVLYKRPAKSANIKIQLAGGLLSATTDDNGVFAISEIMGEDYFFPDQILKKPQAEEIVRRTPLTRQIKPTTLDLMLADLVAEVERKQIPLTITTDEKPQEGEQVNNVSRTFVVNAHLLGDDSIYRIVDRFIEKHINQYIGTLAFDIKDITTRVPINGANFRTISASPSKADLASKYFTDNLMEYAQKRIRDYLHGEELQQNCPTTVAFPVYLPSKISLEVTHPDYLFVTGDVTVSQAAKRVIYMLDKGSKVRVENEKDSGGRIE